MEIYISERTGKRISSQKSRQTKHFIFFTENKNNYCMRCFMPKILNYIIKQNIIQKLFKYYYEIFIFLIFAMKRKNLAHALENIISRTMGLLWV